MTKKQKIDVYQIVTERIISALEEGTVPWRKTWKAGEGELPINLSSMKTYRGANVWMLFAAQYKSRYWLTFNQAKTLLGYKKVKSGSRMIWEWKGDGADPGHGVRKGEKGMPVVFWNFFEKKTGEYNDAGEEVVDKIPFLRYYTVFNSEQIKGIEKFLPKPKTEEEERKFNSIEEAEKIVNGYPAPKVTIQHGGGAASYSHVTNTIQMPEPPDFETDEDYYGTLFHELVHSTGASNRLNRKSLVERGSENYSHEELVAELGASYLCAMTHIDSPSLENNSAAYISGWLEKLKNDKKLVVVAAAQAQKAVDYMTNKVFEDQKKTTEKVVA